LAAQTAILAQWRVALFLVPTVTNQAVNAYFTRPRPDA
jgi:hypothetical protein